MKVNVKIYENRNLRCDLEQFDKDGNIYTPLGVVGENNANVLHFIKPDKINNTNVSEFECTLNFRNTANKTYTYTLNGDYFSLGKELTVSNTLIMYVRFSKDDIVFWESFPIRFLLKPAEDGTGVIIVSVEDLRASILKNLDRNYINKSAEEIIGEAPIYNNGLFATIKETLQSLLQSVNGESNPDSTAMESIMAIDNQLTEVKKAIIDTLNTINSTETAYNTPWATVLNMLDSLPNDVNLIVDDAVAEQVESDLFEINNYIFQLGGSYPGGFIITEDGFTVDLTKQNIYFLSQMLHNYYKNSLANILGEITDAITTQSGESYTDLTYEELVEFAMGLQTGAAGIAYESENEDDYIPFKYVCEDGEEYMCALLSINGKPYLEIDDGEDEEEPEE